MSLSARRRERARARRVARYQRKNEALARRREGTRRIARQDRMSATPFAGRYVQPRTARTGEFFTSSDLNEILEGSLRALANRPAVRVFRENRQRGIGSGQENNIAWEHAHFDRHRIFDRDRAEELVLPNEGVWAAGFGPVFDGNSTGRRQGAVAFNDDGLHLSRVGPGLASDGHVNYQLSAGMRYVYPGDVLRSEVLQDSGDDLDQAPFDFLLHMWAVQLTGRRDQTDGLWDGDPKTWSSGDVIDAATWNAEIRDRLRVLACPPHIIATRGATLTEDDTETTLELEGSNSWSGPQQVASSGGLPDHSEPTIPEAGVYLLMGGSEWEPNASGSQRENRITSTAAPPDPPQLTVQSAVGSMLGDATRALSCSLYGIAEFFPGQQIQGRALQDSGGFLDVNDAPYHSPVLAAVRVGSVTPVTPWTEPTTFGRLSALDPDTLNTYLRDNLEFLRNPPILKLRRAANQSIPSGVWTPIEMDTEVFDTDGMHSGSDAHATVTTPGVYIIGGIGTIASGSVLHTRAALEINHDTLGRFVAASGPYRASGSNHAFVPVVTAYRFRAGDTFRLMGHHLLGSNASTYQESPSLPSLWAVWVGF